MKPRPLEPGERVWVPCPGWEEKATVIKQIRPGYFSEIMGYCLFAAEVKKDSGKVEFVNVYRMSDTPEEEEFEDG